jgi:hypothetical protein
VAEFFYKIAADEEAQAFLKERSKEFTENDYMAKLPLLRMCMGKVFGISPEEFMKRDAGLLIKSIEVRFWRFQQPRPDLCSP